MNLVRKHVGLLCALVLAWGLTSCASAPPFDAAAVAGEWRNYMQRDYPLRPGDKLLVEVSVVQDATGAVVPQEVLVSPTGTITLRKLNTTVTVKGLTVSAVRQKVLDAYQVDYPTVSANVMLLEASIQSVYVSGEAKARGPVPYTPNMTLSQAVAAQGGLDITAKWNDVRVLRVRGTNTKTYRVNLEAILHEEQPDFLLLPGDVVYCQTSSIADVGNWVELYIRRLLPFSVVGPAVSN